MEVKIKPARIENLQEIQKLNLLLFQKEHKEFDQNIDCNWTFSKEGEVYFKKRITQDNSCLFLACIEGKAIGYLAGSLVDKCEYRILTAFAELENIYILDEYRNKGIGTKLYQAFLDWCKSKGIQRLKVETSARNTSAIKFYRKNGFRDFDLILETVI